MNQATIYPQRPDLRGKAVAVIGLARSGLACVRFLLGQGAQVVAADAKPRAQLQDPHLQVTSLGGRFVADFADFGQLGPVELVVISPGVPFDAAPLVDARAAGAEVIGEIELAYRFLDAPIIAVTGTNGKGSTVTMTGKILDAAGLRNVVAGNIGLPLISQVDRAQGSDVIVAEVSSFQLESIRWFRPWQACLLNITPDHLDRHPTYEQYVAAKRRIFENQQADDTAIICTDDPGAAGQLDAVRGRLYTVALQEPCANGRLEGDDLVVEVDGVSRVICTRADLPALGLHQARNALCAAIMGTVCGATPAQIAEGLRAFHPADHLLQTVCQRGGVTYIDDSKATNPASAIADLQALAPPLIVIAGGQGKGLEFGAFGEALGRRCKLVLLIGQCREAIAEAIGARTMVTICDSLEEAVRRAADSAEPGDRVALIPGAASFDMFRDQSQRGEVFARLCRELP